MTTSPLVTIITPWHNHRRYADDYFGSLLAQTYRDLEIILIDDGSTDDSWPKIVEYGERLRRAFPRVVLQRQENAGGSTTMDRLVAQATGEFFCILESDDYYHPTKIEKNVEYLLAHPEAGLVHSDADFVYPDRVESGHWGRMHAQIPTGWVHEALLQKGNYITTCSVCCRTELIRQNVSFHRYWLQGFLMGDYPLYLDLSRLAPFGYIPEPLVCYRVQAESVSHARDPKKLFLFNKSYQEIRLRYLAEWARRHPDANHPLRSAAARSFCESLAYNSREAQHYRDALRYYLLSTRIWGCTWFALKGIASIFPHLVYSRVKGREPVYLELTERTCNTRA